MKWDFFTGWGKVQSNRDVGTPRPKPCAHVTVWAFRRNVCGPAVSSSLPEDYTWWRSVEAEPNHSLWWLIWVSHMRGHTLSEHRWSHNRQFLHSVRQEVCHAHFCLHQCLELEIDITHGGYTWSGKRKTRLPKGERLRSSVSQNNSSKKLQQGQN